MSSAEASKNFRNSPYFNAYASEVFNLTDAGTLAALGRNEREMTGTCARDGQRANPGSRVGRL